MTDAARSGYDAVLLASFGGPRGPDDVMPFLRNVTRGRGVPDERLSEVAAHYLALGGASPINAQAMALRDALAGELSRRGVDLPVLWGNRNWTPYLSDVVVDAAGAGLNRLLAVTTSAYSSYSSCRQYREDFAAALTESETVGTVRIDKVRPYYDLPGFLQPFADGVARALADAADNGCGAADVEIIFTTHSLPIAMAEASGTAAEGQLYVSQHLAACAEVMRRVADGRADAPTWQLAYQSRSGAPHIPWLEPDVCDVIAGVGRSGRRGGVVRIGPRRGNLGSRHGSRRSRCGARTVVHPGVDAGHGSALRRGACGPGSRAGDGCRADAVRHGIAGPTEHLPAGLLRGPLSPPHYRRGRFRRGLGRIGLRADRARCIRDMCGGAIVTDPVDLRSVTR